MWAKSSVQKRLTREQEIRALQVMREYLGANAADGRTIAEVQGERDRQRLEVIDKVLRPLLDSYLTGGITLGCFKTEIDRKNKRYEYWGFKGAKGQMFFNMMVNLSPNGVAIDRELKEAITVPAAEEHARRQIGNFVGYVKRLGDAVVSAGGSFYERPKVGSIPFFLSCFWQIQVPEKWPVFYTNSVQTMADLNLWMSCGNLADDYITFKNVHEELAALMSHEGGEPFDLYGVEHVFWFAGGNTIRGDVVG